MRFVGMLRSDFRRMFHSKSFYFSILGIFAITFFSVWPEIPASQYDVSVYYLTEVRRGIGAFFMAVTVVVVLPYALSYRVDMRHNYIHCLESRAGVSACCWSHVVVTAVGAFLAVFLGYSLFFGVLGFGLPMIKPDEIEMLRVYRESGDLGNYDGLMLSKIPVLYFVVIFATEAMGYAFLAVFTLMVSAKVENAFLLLSVPIMMYYGSLLFCSFAQPPAGFWWFNVLVNGTFFILGGDIGIQMLCLFLYFGSLICVSGLVFVSWVERRRFRG